MTRYTFDGYPLPMQYALTCCVCEHETGELGDEDESNQPHLCASCETDGYVLSPAGVFQMPVD